MTNDDESPNEPAPVGQPRKKNRAGARAWMRLSTRAVRDNPSISQMRVNKVWITLGVFSLALMIGGYRLADRYGLLVGFFAAIGLNVLIFFYDDWRVSKRFPGRDLEGQDPWGLGLLAREVARARGLPTPTLREIQSETPFILSNGLFARSLRIYYSTALIKRFSKAEIKLLFALEMTRFQSGQTRVRSTTVALADSWLALVGFFDSMLPMRILTGGRVKQWCRGPFTALSLPMITVLLRLVTGRQAVLFVDRLISTQDARSLALTLEKLDAYGKTLPIDVNFAEASLFAVDPLARHRWSTWTSVQPPIDQRLRAITGQYPL